MSSESDPFEDGAVDVPANPQVSPERIELELTEDQFVPIAQLLPGDAFPDWLLDLYYDIDRIIDTPGHIPQPPIFKPDARWEVEVPSPAQREAEPITSFRAFMLSPIYSPVAKPMEHWRRADIEAMNTLAENEGIRGGLARAEMDVDKAKAAVKATQEAVDEATQSGDQEAVKVIQKKLLEAEESLRVAEEQLEGPKEAWDDLVVDYNEDTPADGRQLDPVVDAHLKVKAAAGKVVSAAKKPTFAWIKQVFDTIKSLTEKERLIPPKPENFPVGGAYVDSTLYIITMPELAFNGWRNFSAGPEWNAAYPFHEDLEKFIYEQVRKTLRETYPHVRVMFAFSCCTYSSDLLFQVDLKGKENLSDEPKRKLAAANRITIVTSAGPMRPRRITKFYPSSVDGWPAEDISGERLFTKANLLDHSGKRSVARFSEITYSVVDQFGGKEESAVLAFGTCLDVRIDDHHRESAPPVNMCVYLGGGLPLGDIRDAAHPFILNDINSKDWPGGGNDNNWAPGWYQFSPNPIGGQQSDAERWDATGETVDKDSVARKLYWDAALTKEGGPQVTDKYTESRVSYTEVIPLPPAPAVDPQ